MQFADCDSVCSVEMEPPLFAATVNTKRNTQFIYIYILYASYTVDKHIIIIIMHKNQFTFLAPNSILISLKTHKIPTNIIVLSLDIE